MFDIFSRLGKWLLTTLRGSEDGTENGTLHILKTDNEGRLEVAVNYSAMVLDDLGDVDAPTPDAGDVLRYDGAMWNNDTLALADLSDIADTLAPTDGQVLMYDDGTGKWDAATYIPDMSLGDLNNVDDSIVPGSGTPVLQWVGAPTYEFRALSLSINDLNDVDESLFPSTGELLVYGNNNLWMGLPLAGIPGNLLTRDNSGPSWAIPAGAWKLTAVSSYVETLIADGLNDVTAAFVFMYVVHAVYAGDNTMGYAAIECGDTVKIYDNGTDVLIVACDSDGTVTVYRNVGSDTFDITILGCWL